MDKAAFDKQIDENFEGILALADRFVMDNVKKYCLRFLLRKSKRSKLFKFRIAHKYAWIGTKVKFFMNLWFIFLNLVEDFAQNEAARLWVG